MSDHPEGAISPGRGSEAERLDALLGPIDWSTLPAGAVRDGVPAPSGVLARAWIGPVDGPRVLLVPGASGSKEDFALMLPLLAVEGYRVEAFDLAGQYESGAAGPENLDPPGRRYTLELFVDDLIAVLEAGSAPAHVLGYSFAGIVAAEAAIRRPELFASLTLLTCPPIAGQALRGFRILGPLSPFVSGRALGPVFVAALRLNVHRAPRDRARFVAARFDRTRTSSIGDILGLLKRVPDFAEPLRATGIPLLVVIGSRDLWRTEAHRAFAARLGARLVVLPAGHSPCETAPHQLTEAMRELFRDRG